MILLNAVERTVMVGSAKKITVGFDQWKEVSDLIAKEGKSIQAAITAMNRSQDPAKQRKKRTPMVISGVSQGIEPVNANSYERKIEMPPNTVSPSRVANKKLVFDNTNEDAE